MYVKRELKRGRTLEAAYERAYDKLTSDFRLAKRLGMTDYHEYGNLFYAAMSPLNRFEVDHVTDLGAEPDSADTFVGEIHGTQEPGMKLRVFASPKLLFQAVLDPLKKFLMGILHKIPEDACFHTERAVTTIQQWLRKGMKLWSFDISNATDTFPLALSMVALDHSGMIPREYRLLFSLIAKGEWRVNKDLQPTFGCDRVTWNVGQPLGTGPSFGAFSLAHHALIRGICESLRKSPSCYFILGDDVVISDFEVAYAYERLLEALGISISKDKSVISDKVAEFAGYTITANNSFRPGKWREVTAESLMTFVMDPSYDYKQVVPPYWVPLIKRMQATPYPYGLGVPDIVNMSETEADSFVKEVLGLFVRSVTSKSDEELIRDTDLECGFYRHNKLLDSIYPLPQTEDETDELCSERAPLKRFLEKYLLLPRRNRRGIRVDGNRDMFLKRVYYCDYPDGPSWMPCSGASSLLYRGISLDTIAVPDSPRRASSQSQLQRQTVGKSASDAIQGLPCGNGSLYAAVERLAYLLNSIVKSYTRVEVRELWAVEALTDVWIASVPILTEIYSSSVRKPTPLELIRDVIREFPYYRVSDFKLIPSRFTSLLRRYAQAKDVMPPTRVPMPIKGKAQCH
jgi:hypothetical protein